MEVPPAVCFLQKARLAAGFEKTAARQACAPERAGQTAHDIRHWRGHGQRGTAGKKHSPRALCAARVWPRRARAAAGPQPGGGRGPDGTLSQGHKSAAPKQRPQILPPKRPWPRRWAQAFRALCGCRHRRCARQMARPILPFRAALPKPCGKRALRRIFPLRTRAGLPRLLWCWNRRPGPPHTQRRRQNDNTGTN